MKYKCVVYGYDSGLNELLNAQTKKYDPRMKKMRVYNSEKAKNDRLCEKAIRNCQNLKNVHIHEPVLIKYHFYLKDKKRDRSNSLSAFTKSFEDALQHCKVIDNDTYDLVLTPEYFFDIDKSNPRVEVEIITADKGSNLPK